MTPFIIFLLVVTFAYIIYYAVIITLDLNAKPKDDGSHAETIETGMDDTSGSQDNADDEEQPSVDRDLDESQSEDREDVTYEQRDDMIPEEENNVEAQQVPYQGEESSVQDYTEETEETVGKEEASLPSTDDDVYGLGDGEEETDYQFPPEPSDAVDTTGEPDDSEEGETIVEPLEIDETDYTRKPEKKMGVTTVYEGTDDSKETAAHLSNIGESILAESLTPVKELHSENMMSIIGIKRKVNVTKI